MADVELAASGGFVVSWGCGTFSRNVSAVSAVSTM